MDALGLLTADHNRVRGLFTRFQAAEESGDTTLMTQLAQQIVTELQVHTQIEEELFYPAVRGKSDELDDVIAEGVEEHHVAKTLIGEIEALSAQDEAWRAKMKVLIESVEHHASEEEDEMFTQIRKSVDAATLQALGEQLEQLKASLGAPTAADKEHLTLQQLKDMAGAQEIPGRSSMDREELVATVAPEGTA
jgi:hemerythrin superfamily protein